MITKLVTGLDWTVILWRALGFVVAVAVWMAPGWFIRGWYDGDEIAMLQKSWAEQQATESMNFAEQMKEQKAELETLRRAEREKDAKYEMRIDDLHRRELALRAGLRNRAERPELSASGAALACQAGATGAELSRPDAEFLVGEAARADQLRAALERCQGGNVATDGGRLDH